MLGMARVDVDYRHFAIEQLAERLDVRFGVGAQGPLAVNFLQRKLSRCVARSARDRLRGAPPTSIRRRDRLTGLHEHHYEILTSTSSQSMVTPGTAAICVFPLSSKMPARP